MTEVFDAIIVGGGQSGLATAYYLQKTGMNYLMLDKETRPGGSWQHYWTSLRLFSPAQWSSLPGVLFPGGTEYYPSRDEVVEYLKRYESKYSFPLQRGVEVHEIHKPDSTFLLKTSNGSFRSRSIISATGSFAHPFIPEVSGLATFKGKVLHSADYRSPHPFKNKNTAIIGEGNSGAQILAELSKTSNTHWFTSKQPKFLPDHIDGRYLFDAATQMYKARKRGETYNPPSLGDIVMTDSVKEAKRRKAFENPLKLDHFTKEGIETADGTLIKIDTAIFCTGFVSALDHLKTLPVTFQQNRLATTGTRSTEVPGLWLVGYGNWTGFASATLIGVGRSARQTVSELQDFLQG